MCVFQLCQTPGGAWSATKVTDHEFWFRKEKLRKSNYFFFEIQIWHQVKFNWISYFLVFAEQNMCLLRLAWLWRKVFHPLKSKTRQSQQTRFPIFSAFETSPNFTGTNAILRAIIGYTSNFNPRINKSPGNEIIKITGGSTLSINWSAKPNKNPNKQLKIVCLIREIRGKQRQRVDLSWLSKMKKPTCYLQRFDWIDTG